MNESLRQSEEVPSWVSLPIDPMWLVDQPTFEQADVLGSLLLNVGGVLVATISSVECTAITSSQADF